MLDDYLTHEDMKDLRKNYRLLTKSDGGTSWEPLPGANYRAVFKVYNGMVVLKSYYTDVMILNLETKKVIRLWDGYSRTTQKHINTLLTMFGCTGLNKKEWENLPIVN